jgi:hypothetical protein
MKRDIILLVFLSVVVFNSCQPKREEYTANIKIINNSNSVINKITLKADAEKKIIEMLQLNENYEFEVKWTGRSSSFLASMDNSYIFLEITYSIGDEIFDIKNEKGVLRDSYGGYHSEKTITDGSRILIEIDNDGYEILNEY